MARTRVRVRKRKSRKKIKEEAKLQIAQPKSPPQTIYWVLTPKGRCPVTLEGKAPIDIDRWVAEVKKTGNHTVQSVCYWIRDFYEIFSDDYYDVREYIHTNHKDLDLRNVSSRNFSKQIAAK